MFIWKAFRRPRRKNYISGSIWHKSFIKIVKYSFPDEGIVYRSFLNTSIISKRLHSWSEKLHAQLPAKMCNIHLFRSQTQNTIWQNRDFDPRLCERRAVKSNFCLLLLCHFRKEVKLFALSWIHLDVFCLFLREEGAQSELHFAVRVCRKHGSKSVYCWSSQLL